MREIISRPSILTFRFINAKLGEKDLVLCRLPKVWSRDHKGDIVRLVRALYGLPQASRAWYKTYQTWLQQHGWEQCKADPGLWRKASEAAPGKYVKLSVYVDDNVLAGPNLAELQKLKQHSSV